MMIVLHCRITGIQTKKTISGSHQSGQKSNIKDTSENAVAFYYYSLQKLHILSGTRYIHVVIGTAAQILILHRLWNRFHTNTHTCHKESALFVIILKIATIGMGASEVAEIHHPIIIAQWG